MDIFLGLIKDKVSNFFFLTILIIFFFLNEMNVNRKNDRIKLSIIYLVFLTLSSFNIYNTKEIVFSFILSSFVYLEYISSTSFQKKYFSISYNILDYVYKIFFEYKIFYFIVSLFFTSSFFIYISNFNKTAIILFGYGLVFYQITKIYNNKFETKTLEEIYEYCIEIKNFESFKASHYLKELYDILVFKEDKSYFYRENSFNLFNLEFLKYKYNNMKFYILFNKKIKNKLILNILTIINMIKKIIIFSFNLFLRFVSGLKNRNIKKLIRGYSTIEMQLVRTLAVTSGYDNSIFQRKIYEWIYSYLFFKSLKKNYIYFKYNNVKEYKNYLLYLYLKVAPVKINGFKYDNIDKLYGETNYENITKEQFYIYTLGLSNEKIEYEYIKNNNAINKFKLSRKKIKEEINKLKR